MSRDAIAGPIGQDGADEEGVRSGGWDDQGKRARAPPTVAQSVLHVMALYGSITPLVREARSARRLRLS